MNGRPARARALCTCARAKVASCQWIQRSRAQRTRVRVRMRDMGAAAARITCAFTSSAHEPTECAYRSPTAVYRSQPWESVASSWILFPSFAQLLRAAPSCSELLRDRICAISEDSLWSPCRIHVRRRVRYSTGIEWDSR